MRRRAFAIPLLLAVALGATACGSDDDNDQARSEVDTTVSSTVVGPSTTVGPTSSTTPTTASPPSTAAPLGPGSRLRTDGVGPVSVGMSLDEARQAAGIPMTRNDGPHCRSLSPADTGVPVSIVAEGGDRVNFINVTTGPIRTVSGIGIGSTEAEVVAAYPDQVEVRPGAPEAHWVIYRPRGRAQSSFSVVFVIDGGKVRQMKAGFRQNTEADENCG